MLVLHHSPHVLFLKETVDNLEKYSYLYREGVSTLLTQLSMNTQIRILDQNPADFLCSPSAAEPAVTP